MKCEQKTAAEPFDISSTLSWFVILISLFESAYLVQFPVIDRIYTLLKLIGIAFVFFNVGNIKINLIETAIITMEAGLWYSTYRMGNLKLSAKMFSVVFFIIIIGIMMEINAEQCIRLLYNIFEILIIINFLSMLFFPNGLYHPLGIGEIAVKKYYFLGHQNSMGIYNIIGITLGQIRMTYEKNSTFKKRLAVLELICLIYVFKVWSAISIVGTLCIIALHIYDELTDKGVRVSLTWWLVGSVFVFIFFAVMQNLSIFRGLFETVLHRELTLSGRTEIWRKAYSVFLTSPIWGVGSGQGVITFGFTTAHNRFMNTLFTGGIVGFVILLSIFFIASYSIRNYNKKINRCLLYYFISLLIMMQGESYDGMPFYVMFIIAYQLNQQSRQLEKT